MGKVEAELNIEVYIDGAGGTVHVYPVATWEKAREHANQIILTGFRDNDGSGEFAYIPPHRIFKVKITGGKVPTGYPSKTRGT